jgi:hypothetical protein
MSLVVHTSSSVQVFELGMLAHPSVPSQVSVVQGLSSSQLLMVSPVQIPPLHWSPLVHAFPSLHPLVLWVYLHPVSGTQESLVHELLSSQSSGLPPMHTPSVQVSPTVHAFPSMHASSKARF